MVVLSGRPGDVYASSGLFACSSHLLNGIIPSNGVMWSSISMGHAQTLRLGMGGSI